MVLMALLRDMTERVLVPFDDSEPARAALEFALENHPEAAFTIVYVIDPGDFFVGIEGGSMLNYDQLQSAHEESAEDVLETAKTVAAKYDVEPRTEVLSGRIAKTIVDFATEEGVDAIVMGSHGRTGAARILLGSVAETVVRRATMPVTIVR